MTLIRTDIFALLGALTTLTAPAGATGAEPDTRRPAVACTLDTAEKRERRALVERELMPHLLSVTELANGWVLWFDRADGRLEQVASFVDLERRCCAFLDFAIRLDGGGDRIALELSGPEGTREMLAPLIERRAAK